MVLRFNTINLEWYDIIKQKDYVELQLKYKDLPIQIIKKEIKEIQKIFHYHYYEINNIGVITFFYYYEVFGMEDIERKEIASTFPKTIKNEISKTEIEEY